MNVTSFLTLSNPSSSSEAAPVYSPFVFSHRQGKSSSSVHQNSFSKHHSLFSPGYRSRDHHFIKEIAPTKILNEKIDLALESGADIVATSTLTQPSDIELKPVTTTRKRRSASTTTTTTTSHKKSKTARRQTLLDD